MKKINYGFIYNQTDVGNTYIYTGFNNNMSKVMDWCWRVMWDVTVKPT